MATKIYSIFLICFFALFLQESLGRDTAPAPTVPLLVRTEHIDFIYLRLSHLLDLIPSEICALRRLLQEELDQTPGYREAWEEGTKIFQSRTANLVEAEDIEIPNEYHIALITYTIHDTPKDWAFYAMFNTATRNLGSGLSVKDYPYKSFFQLIRLATETLGKKTRFAPTAEQLYRGVTIRHDFTLGLYVAFQQYSSLSANRTVSEQYSNGITLLTFKAMKRIGISLFHHSKFPGEAEILVSPFQVFKVVKLGVPGAEGIVKETFTLSPIDDGSGFKYFRFGRAKVNELTSPKKSVCMRSA